MYDSVLQYVYIHVYTNSFISNSEEWVESNQDHSLKMKGFKGGGRKVKCRGPPIDFRHRLVPSTTVTVICIKYFTLYLLLRFLSRSSPCTCIVLAVNVLGYSFVKSIWIVMRCGRMLYRVYLIVIRGLWNGIKKILKKLILKGIRTFIYLNTWLIEWGYVCFIWYIFVSFFIYINVYYFLFVLLQVFICFRHQLNKRHKIYNIRYV